MIRGEQVTGLQAPRLASRWLTERVHVTGMSGCVDHVSVYVLILYRREREVLLPPSRASTVVVGPGSVKEGPMFATYGEGIGGTDVGSQRARRLGCPGGKQNPASQRYACSCLSQHPCSAAPFCLSRIFPSGRFLTRGGHQMYCVCK